jgi:hypothetical protein
MPVIKGTLVQASKNEWLHDTGQLSVQVRLCKYNDEVKKLNQGKDEPIMLKDVTRVGTDQGFPNAVICDRGSNIEFGLKSKGPYGYGIHIASGQEVICERLYCIDTTNSPGQALVEDVIHFYHRDSKSGSFIRVDDFPTLGIEGDREAKAKYWSCRVFTWPIFGFKKGERIYGRARGEATAKVLGAGPTQGNVSHGVVEKFELLSEEPDRQAKNNGMCTIYFFVFEKLQDKKEFYTTHSLGAVSDF